MLGFEPSRVRDHAAVCCRPVLWAEELRELGSEEPLALPGWCCAGLSSPGMPRGHTASLPARDQTPSPEMGLRCRALNSSAETCFFSPYSLPPAGNSHPCAPSHPWTDLRSPGYGWPFPWVVPAADYPWIPGSIRAQEPSGLTVG